MKRTGFVLLIASLLGCLPIQAQLNGLINKGIKAAKKVKEVKEDVDEIIKKTNGDIDFFYMDNHRGFYRSKNRKIVFDDLHQDGKRAGKNAVYTIEKNGDVMFDDGRKVGEVLEGGVVNCHSTAPYLRMEANGDVVMNDEVVGHVDEAGDVTLEGIKIGYAPGIDKQVAAYIFFGILFDAKGIANVRAKVKEEKLRAEEERLKAEKERKEAAEARKKAEQEAAAKRQAAAAANQNKNKKVSGNNGNSKTVAKKVQEWPIEKGSARGFVDANGVVYDWSHKKIGQLPKNGIGDIKDGYGNNIGRISMGDIYDSSGNKVCTVSSGGSISVPGSNTTVAEVRGSGRIDMMADSKTLGYCDVRPYEWAVAIIYCNFFKF